MVESVADIQDNNTSVQFPALLALYNVYWHPLSKYPGPWLWAAFRLPYATALWKGKYVSDIYQMHEEYGDIVRVAPNELSYANKQAWQDIYCYRAGHRPFPKNPIWWGDFPGRTPSIVSTPDHAAHERMRKLLSYCFSVKALKGQECTIHYHTDLMIRKFREKMHTKNRATINVVNWYMFLTFDVLGDLGFGESFNCLNSSTLHPWVGTIFNYFKIAAYIGLLRLYTSRSIDRVLMICAPKSAVKTSKEHYEWAVEKVHRRMNLDTQRDDFMSHILEHNDKDGMSIDEIENNTNVLIVAGSETCGTVLSGTTNYLMKFPMAYHKLVEEIRTTFHRTEDMTFKALADLPYLNAVIEEGLRMSPPSASGLAHLVPQGGDTVCGTWLPEGVSLKSASRVDQRCLYKECRPTSLSISGPYTAPPPNFIAQMISYRNGGFRYLNQIRCPPFTMTTSRLCKHSQQAHGPVLASNWRMESSGLCSLKFFGTSI